MMDFTAKKYFEILHFLKKNEYTFLRVQDYLTSNSLPEKFVIIRHDVDLDPFIQLKFAEAEAKLNVVTSYYFRHIKSIFKKDTITEIYNLDHEIGYHYEVITKAKGDQKLALQLFLDELEEFKQNWNSKTICPHGGSFNPNFNAYNLQSILKNLPKFIFNQKTLYSSWSNFNIWKNYHYSDFNLLGDAYDSINFDNFLYLSDTGRSWKKKHKRLDHVQSTITDQIDIRNSNHLLKLIESGDFPRLYLLFHLEQWKDNLKDWTGWYLSQIMRRTGKKIVFKNG